MKVKNYQSKSQKNVGGRSGADDEVENQVDEFDFESPIDYNQASCAMCKEDHKFGVIFTNKMEEMFKHSSKDSDDDGDDDEIEDDDIHVATGSPTKIKIASSPNHSHVNFRYFDPQGVWLSKHALNMGLKRRVFVHYYCALCSPRCFFDGKVWKNVKKEVTRSASLTCFSCTKKGATIKCRDKKCPAVFHIPCALKIGLKSDFNNNYIKFTCPEHIQLKQSAIEQLDKLGNEDVSKGRECIPIKAHNDIDDELLCQPCTRSSTSGDYVTDFSYISVNLDSDNVLATCQAVMSIKCCNCVGGLCNNADTCACLKDQRNYTNKGTLITGLKSPIFECNMRCSCNIRRCTNRVVTQGIKCGLEVFRGELGSSISSSSSPQVETADNHKKPKLMSRRVSRFVKLLFLFVTFII